METEKLQTLVDRLIWKTEGGELRWREGVRRGSYQYSFPDYSIIIEALFELGKPTQIIGHSLRILDQRGEAAGHITSDDLNFEGAQVPARKLMRLFEAARTSSALSEKVVDDLLARLA